MSDEDDLDKNNKPTENGDEENQSHLEKKNNENPSSPDDDDLKQEVKPAQPPEAAPEAENKGESEGESAKPTKNDQTTSSDAGISAKKVQPQQRAENKDYLKVLGLYGDYLSVPQVYIDHINVNKDFNMGGGQAAPGFDQIPPEKQDSSFVPKSEWERIKQVFVQPVLFQQAVERLRKQRVIILYGKADIGKRASAIMLACNVGDPNKHIREFSPDENLLTQLNGVKPEKGTVYLVTSMLSSKVGELKEIQARNIIRWAEQNEVFLIITTSTKVPVNNEIQVMVWHQPENANLQIFIEHLKLGNILDANQIDVIVENVELVKLLNQTITPRQISQLSAKILEKFEADPGIDVNNKDGLGKLLKPILDEFNQGFDEKMETWLFEIWDDLDEVTFRIALAVFNGTNYEDIYRAGKDLLQLVKPPEKKEKDEEAGESKNLPEPFNPSKAAGPRLRKAGAKRVIRTVYTEYSNNAEIEVVELDDDRYTPQALRFVWREIIDWRDPLLEWLTVYAISKPSTLRLRASAAIGYLAGVEFDIITRRIFKPWALNNLEQSNYRRKVYQALMNSLGFLIWDDAQEENTLGLLNDWVNNNNLFIKWAAARCYASVGLRRPKTAISQWRSMLAKMDEISMALTDEMGLRFVMTLDDSYLQDYVNTLKMQKSFMQSVVDAILTLFSKAVEFPNRLEPVFEQALEALFDWIRHDEKEKVKNSLALFLFILIMDIRVPDENNLNNEEEWPPAMLYIVNTQKDSNYRRILAEMLHRALNHPDQDVREKTFSELKMWVEIAEKQLWLKEALLKLLLEIFALPDLNPRFINRLKRYLTIWRRHPKNPLETAEQIYQELNL